MAVRYALLPGGGPALVQRLQRVVHQVTLPTGCYTAHHSFTNRTNQGRRALLYTYNPASDGDTYPVCKGEHTRLCADWLKAERERDAPKEKN